MKAAVVNGPVGPEAGLASSSVEVPRQARAHEAPGSVIPGAPLSRVRILDAPRNDGRMFRTLRLTLSPVFRNHEFQSGPDLVDGADLDVDEPKAKRGVAHDNVRQIGRDA